MADANVWMQENLSRQWIVGDEEVIRVQTLTKDYEESLRFTFDFSQKSEVQEGDAITALVSVSASPDGLTLTSGEIDYGLYQAHIIIAGGTSGTHYALRCKVLTFNGYTMVGKGNLVVE